MLLLCTLALLASLVKGIKYPEALRLYPGPVANVNLSGIVVSDSVPMRVWSSGTTGAASIAGTDGTRWFNSTSGSSNFNCTGLWRYGGSGQFTAPVSSSVWNSTCSLDSLRSYLWSERIGSSNPSCECRPALAMKLTHQFQGANYCFGAPSASNGWPTPALVNCSDQSNQVTPVYYHRFSGQIRSEGMCLTASPYSSSTNSSSVWKPWAVKWLPCSNMNNPSQRQSWDAPDGAGEVLFDAVLPWLSTNGGTPSGHKGRITLRDSGDVALRCLDVAYQVINVPVLIQGIFLEAPLCDDSRVAEAEKAIWRFFQYDAAVNGDLYSFTNCRESSCSDCGGIDAELRLQFGTNQGSSETVSAPYGYDFNQVCSADLLRAVALPDVEGKCYCQSHALKAMGQLSSLISGSADDLPSTVRPSFPQRNITSSR